MAKKLGEIVNGKYVSYAKATPTQRESFASMLASGHAPGLKTDTQFLSGRHVAYGADDPYLAAKLKRNGADPNGVYHSYLARYPGDPRACVSSRDDLRKRLIEDGKYCEGTVTVRPDEVPDVPPPPRIDVADDIVDRETAKVIKLDPSLGETKKKRAATREATKERLKGNAA